MKRGLPMTRGSLDGVDAFLRVAERASFSAAAAELGVSPSAISQTIRALEDRIGVPLFTRTTRSVGLTQAGQVFLDRCKPAMADLAEAVDAARNLGERATGLLRINLLRAVIEPLFSPILASFCETYPDIELEIFADDSFADLSSGGFDAGVRLGETLAADMVAVRLSPPFRFVVVGTPDYFAHHGKPETLDDLAHHRCLRMRLGNGRIMPWTFVDGNRQIELAVSGPVIVNDFTAQNLVLQSGVALAYVAEPSVATGVTEGRLETALNRYSHSSGGLFLYYPSRRQMMPKLRAFIDHVRANAPADRILGTIPQI